MGQLSKEIANRNNPKIELNQAEHGARIERRKSAFSLFHLLRFSALWLLWLIASKIQTMIMMEVKKGNQPYPLALRLLGSEDDLQGQHSVSKGIHEFFK